MLQLATLGALFLAGGGSTYEVGHFTGILAAGVPAEVYYPADVAGEQVPVAAGEHPLVVFGHGFLMPATAYGYLSEGLAACGFVVALPATALELFPDHGAFAQDFTALAAGLLAASEQPGDLLFGSLSGRVAAMGHSMGAGASVLAAAADPTFIAVANLAAAETNPSAVAAAGALSQPVLLLSGGDDCITPPSQQQSMYAAASSSCKAWLTLEGASHCQFASTASACELGEVFCSSAIAAQAQHELVLSLVVPWLEGVLKLDTSAWADFITVSASTPGVQQESACSSGLTLLTIGGLDAAQEGSLELAGEGFEFVVGAGVGGAPVPFEVLGPTTLVLDVPSAEPGIFDLDVQGLFGSLGVPGVVYRYPALAPDGAPQLGQTLQLDLFTGAPAAYAVVGSVVSSPPLQLPGVGHSLQLGLPLTILGSGATGAGGLGSLGLALPSNPALQGLDVFVQGYSELASGASFTNQVVLSLEI